MPCAQHENVSEFLSKFGRALRPIGGDGNCLFRSLSYCLFETEYYHSPLRCLLARFESRNERVFTSHLPQQSHSQQSSILEHVKRISNPGTWGTDLELLAAATYFQIPVYFCCTDNVTDKWLWNRVQPIASPTDLAYPVVVDSFPERSVAPTHFEIVYWRDTHYDSVVSRETGKPCTIPPAIATIHEYIDDVL